MKGLAEMPRITLQTALQVRQFCATAPLGLFARFLSAFFFSKFKRLIGKCIITVGEQRVLLLFSYM